MEYGSFFHCTFCPLTPGKEKIREVLPVAPTPPPRQLTELELQKVREDEENTLRELRIFLREIHTKLLVDRRFKEFSKPVDLEEVNKPPNQAADPQPFHKLKH